MNRNEALGKVYDALADAIELIPIRERETRRSLRKALIDIEEAQR